MREKLFTVGMRRYFWPFFGGLLYAAGFPIKDGFSFFLFPIFGFILLLAGWNFSSLFSKTQGPETFGTRILSTICFSVGYYTLGYYWIPYTISVFGGIYFPFNYLLGLIFSFVILPQYYVFLFAQTGFQRLQKRGTFPHLRSTQWHLFYALFLTLFEYIVPQQFPAHLGHPWLQLAPYLGLAPYFGAPLFSFMSYWLAFSLYDAIFSKKSDWWCWAAVTLFLILNVLFPLQKESPKDSQKTTTTHLRMVQGNIGNYLKMASENGLKSSVSDVLESFKSLSTAPSQDPLDLIIWPETAYPRLLSTELLNKGTGQTPTLFKEIIESTTADLFIGGYDRKNLHSQSFYENEYNSAFLFHRDKKFAEVYHKIRLIPFGESLPFGPLNNFLSQYIQNISYFAQGEEYTLFKTSEGVPFTTAICYEILFSSFIRDYLNSAKTSPHFIVNLTNDSWYGDTSEPLQHLFLAKWRALEFQLPIVRMTNTGVSSVLYTNGSESDRLQVGEKDFLDVSLETTNKKKTFFQKWGIWGTLFIFGILFLLTQAHVFMTRAKSPLSKGRGDE